MTKEYPSAQPVALNQPISKAAYDYWNALRNGRPLPLRRDVDPARMRRFLPNVLLLERGRGGDVLFRLAGTAVCLAFGRELRDHSLLSLWDSHHCGVVGTAVSASLCKGAPLLLRFHGHALGRQPLTGELMLLPLLDDAGAATRLLGSFAFARDPLGPKVFTRLGLLRAETLTPARDRVELAMQAPAPPRAALSLVPTTGRHAPAALPNMSRPWAGLLRDFLRCEDG